MKLLIRIMTTLQVFAGIIILMLHNLTLRNEAVMKYIYISKSEHMRLLSLNNRIGIVIYLLILVVTILWVFKEYRSKRIMLVIIFIINVSILLLPLQDILVYSYLLASSMLILLLEYVKLGLKERSI